jgi:hypothetical protein
MILPIRIEAIAAIARSEARNDGGLLPIPVLHGQREE